MCQKKTCKHVISPRQWFQPIQIDSKQKNNLGIFPHLPNLRWKFSKTSFWKPPRQSTPQLAYKHLTHSFGSPKNQLRQANPTTSGPPPILHTHPERHGGHFPHHWNVLKHPRHVVANSPPTFGDPKSAEGWRLPSVWGLGPEMERYTSIEILKYRRYSIFIESWNIYLSMVFINMYIFWLISD